MHLAVLPLDLDFKTFGLPQYRMHRGTVRLGWAPFRQEKFITNLAEQFFPGVAGNFCRHPVGVKNPAVSADKHHGLREAFENSAIERLRLCLKQHVFPRFHSREHIVQLWRRNRPGATTNRCFDNDSKVTATKRCYSASHCVGK